MSRVLPVAVAAAVTAVLVVAGADFAFAHRPLEPTQGTLYVIGDSWSAGLYADSAHTLAQDAAERIGMAATVDAESGTGYLTAPGATGTYEQRAAAIPAGTTADIVILQGGSNDDGSAAAPLSAAVTRTIAAVRHALPQASMVLLGPGPDPWPVTAKQRAVDTVLARVSAADAVTYISPMRDDWFTSANVHSIIDADNDHPTVAGDAVLGGLLATALLPVLDDRLTRLCPSAPGVCSTASAGPRPSDIAEPFRSTRPR